METMRQIRRGRLEENPKKLGFLYPAVKMRNTKESDNLIPLLWKLLDCNAGISLPDDADKLYATRLVILG